MRIAEIRPRVVFVQPPNEFHRWKFVREYNLIRVAVRYRYGN
jgi:hypothetical protein